MFVSCPDESQMSHVSSSDSLNGRRTSSDSGKDPEGPGALGVPSDSTGPRVSPERRGSGPGPVVARRKSSDTGKQPRVGSWQERRSCSSLSEKETAESPFSNGCIDRWSIRNKPDLGFKPWSGVSLWRFQSVCPQCWRGGPTGRPGGPVKRSQRWGSTWCHLRWPGQRQRWCWVLGRTLRIPGLCL